MVEAIPQEPHIRVLTPFPEGDMYVSFIDIVYTAVPTPGAQITEIYYRISGGPEEYIYISAASRFSARGTLGEARVFIRPQTENRFVFYMRDTAGGVFSYEVAMESPPVLTGFLPSPWIDFDTVIWVDRYRFIETNLINVRAPWSWQDSATTVSFQEMQAFADYLGVDIVGHRVMTGAYTFGFPPKTYEELTAFVERLERDYPNLVYRAGISRGHSRSTATAPGTYPASSPAQGGQGLTTFRDTTNPRNQPTNPPTADPRSQPTNPPTADYFWGRIWSDDHFYSYPRDWGFWAANVPSAWGLMAATQEKNRSTRVGIIDTWFNPYHEDLQLLPTQVRNIPVRPSATQDYDHGNFVAGIIGAIHDNVVGIAGVANLPREEIYAYGVTGTDREYGNALYWLVVNGSQVVNVSMGPTDGNVWANEELDFLLNTGYDFLILQAVPNASVEVTSDQLIFTTQPRNIINVSSSTQEGYVFTEVGWGDLVDMAAPGHGIFSLREENSGMSSGASFATPFVSGAAALVWQANPGLTASEVRLALLGTANKPANRIPSSQRCGLFCFLPGVSCSVPAQELAAACLHRWPI